MATCKRCGSVFNYSKTDGVCPKCCYYNRPDNARREDENWLDNYNKIENGYRELVKNQHEDKDLTGSHIHLDDGKIGKYIRPSKTKSRQRSRNTVQAKNQPAIKIFRKIIIITVIIWLIVLVVGSVGTFIWRDGQDVIQVIKEDILGDDSNIEEAADMDFQVESEDWSEGGMSIDGGNICYDLEGKAKVLFKEGTLPGMPAGEKCIGIYMSDSGIDVEYNGYDWNRPYVYDGKDYRCMVDVSLLDDKTAFSNIKTITNYTSTEREEEGYAIFFVDNEAKEVTLCVPLQFVDESDSNSKEYSGVNEVTIPIE